MTLSKSIKRSLTLPIVAGGLLLPAMAAAAPYGAGGYGKCDYNETQSTAACTNALFTIGNLPVTGSTLLWVFGAACLAIAVGLVVWVRNKRRSAPIAA